MVGRGHVAEVFVLEQRFGLALAQLEHDDCAGKGHRRDNANHGKCIGDHAGVSAAGVGLLGPRLLLAQNCRHAFLARGGELRHPIAGEGDARLGEFALMYAGYGIGNHGLVRVERHVARERTVAPCTEVIALDGRRSGSGICEVNFHLDVIGVRRPAVAHKLPVKLGGIGPVHNRTGHGVAHVIDRAVATLVGAEHLDLYAAVGLLNRIDAVVAFVCIVNPAKRGIIFLDAQHIDTRRTTLLVGARIDIPIHAVDVVVEIKLAPLDNGQRSIGLNRGTDIGLGHGIPVGTCNGGQQQQHARDECANGSKSRKQAALPTSIGNGGVHRHILCL